jgi:hypothetical protein
MVGFDIGTKIWLRKGNVFYVTNNYSLHKLNTFYITRQIFCEFWRVILVQTGGVRISRIHSCIRGKDKK